MTWQKRAAREARVLAMECVGGVEPPLAVGIRFEMGTHRRCAFGWVEVRTGVRFYDPRNPAHVLVAHANDMWRGGLPWALLALADDLESAGNAEGEKALP